jgi:hypothetical protein
MTEPRRAILDVVELRADAGRWPAGTVASGFVCLDHELSAAAAAEGLTCLL